MGYIRARRLAYFKDGPSFWGTWGGRTPDCTCIVGGWITSTGGGNNAEMKMENIYCYKLRIYDRPLSSR